MITRILTLTALFALACQTADAALLTGITGFVRNDQVLTWSTANNGDITLRPGLRFRARNTMSSSLNKTTAGTGRWYDSIVNSADLIWTHSPDLTFTLSAREDWNRDTFSRQGQTLLTTAFDGSIDWRANRNLRLRAGIGGLYDKRFDKEDTGATATGSVEYSGSPARNLRTGISVEGAASNLDRAANSVTVRGTVGYLNSLANLTLELLENRHRQGYFSDVNRTHIEERERVERTASLMLVRGDVIRPGPSLAMLLQANVGGKRIDDTANTNERSSKYRTNTDGRLHDMSLTVARRLFGHITAMIEGGYARDDNTVERKDRSRTQTDISLRGQVGAGFGADSLRVMGWIKRTRIDTPPGIPNDRDELKFETGVNYLRTFSRFLQSGLDFRVLETHYVNIDASQSTQNKWIKTYQVSPFLVVTPVRSVRFAYAVNLYANHMDYDYDSDLYPRSNITRRITSESTLEAALSPRVRLVVEAMFESNDYGNLDSAGRKLPVEEGIRRFGGIAVECRFREWVRLTPRYRYAVRRDTNIERDSLIRREIDQTFGLDGALFENLTGDYHLTFSVKRIYRETASFPTRIRNYIDISLRYGF